MKTCSKCKEEKPLDQFIPRSDRPGKLYSWCKPCYVIRCTENNVKRKYGITIEEIKELVEAQQGRCASCGDYHGAWGKDGLVVDHCHVSGDVRELLCTTCNVALGMLKDDPERIMKLAEYARKHGE